MGYVVVPDVLFVPRLLVELPVKLGSGDFPGLTKLIIVPALRDPIPAVPINIKVLSRCGVFPAFEGSHSTDI